MLLMRGLLKNIPYKIPFWYYLWAHFFGGPFSASLARGYYHSFKEELNHLYYYYYFFYQYSSLECRSSACPKGAFAVRGSGIFSSLQKLYK